MFGRGHRRAMTIDLVHVQLHYQWRLHFLFLIIIQIQHQQLFIQQGLLNLAGDPFALFLLDEGVKGFLLLCLKVETPKVDLLPPLLAIPHHCHHFLNRLLSAVVAPRCPNH